MKINAASILLLLRILSTAAAGHTPNNAPTLSRTSREPITDESFVPGLDALSTPDAPAKGTLDAPVDGKDGRPHAGPWVETNAERDRKKTSSGESTTASNSKIATPDQVGPDGKPIPHSNDGVMDDPHRPGPKEGTRGTEGGVSEKQKDSSSVAEKVPDAPKEAPPLPHSEQQKMTTTAEKADGKDNVESESAAKSGTSNLGVLEKPNDLPEKPHDIPPPKPAAAVEKDHLAIVTPPASHGSSGKVLNKNVPSGTVVGSLHSLFFSFTMIIFSEIGDKTFLVAALMAMRHPRLVVFSAAFSALITMTVLSAILGHAVPTLIPKSLTKALAAVLFLVFGLKMLKEGREMSPDEGVGEEMREVEMELEEKEQQQLRKGRRRSAVSPHILESGRAGRHSSRSSQNRLPSPPESVSSTSSREPSPGPLRSLTGLMTGINNLCSLLLSPAWVQTFVMTFLGEWGDRSQIATIAMAAGQDYWWVTIGAITGHGICTAAAVIGGRAIAGKVSIRVVTLGGAFAFLIFGIIYLIEATY